MGIPLLKTLLDTASKRVKNGYLLYEHPFRGLVHKSNKEILNVMNQSSIIARNIFLENMKIDENFVPYFLKLFKNLFSKNTFRECPVRKTKHGSVLKNPQLLPGNYKTWSK